MSLHLASGRRIRLQRRHLVASTGVLAADRLWFQQHPAALVRFRPERPVDFALLRLQGQAPPVFVPEQCDPSAPLSWVAVVDIMRAIGIPAVDGCLRCRIRTVPIRSRRLQSEMAEVFAIAVCQDVLAQLQAQVDASQQSA